MFGSKSNTATAAKDEAQVPAVQAQGGALAVFDYGAMEGKGFEGQTQDDRSLPYFAIMQGITPQLSTIDGAKLGDVWNTVTNEFYRGGIDFVAAGTKRMFVRWKKRAEGGGLVGTYTPDDPIVKKIIDEATEFGQFEIDGDDLIDTRYVFGIRVQDGEPAEQGMLAFSGTKIKKYKAWQTKASTLLLPRPKGEGKFNPPLFGIVYHLGTVKEKNPKGEYYNWDVTFQGGVAKLLAPDSRVLKVAHDLYQSVIADNVNIKHEGAGGTSGKADEEIPF
jgi:hypothetical protein